VVYSDAATVEEYLAGLPEDRREAISTVREVIRKHLPAGVVEAVNWGMIAYEIPLSAYPDTYNGQPLMYAALASQKNYMAIYLHAVYGSEELRKRFEAAYQASGKKLDMGKSCVRFKTLDALPLDVIADAIGAGSVEKYLTRYEELMASRTSPARKPAPRKTARTKA
jgi:transposase